MSPSIPSDKAVAIYQASQKYHVPIDVLLGVYGQETSFGSDVTTSSAGAMGSFQFIQGTAASYKYPYTNATDINTFSKQADASAHLLSDSYKKYGSWDKAIRYGYGGGYGLTEVQKQAATEKGAFTKAITGNKGGGVLDALLPGPLTAGIQNASDVANTVSSAADVATAFYKTITNPQFWIRAAEAIAGTILIILGLKAITGAGSISKGKTGKLAKAAVIA